MSHSSIHRDGARISNERVERLRRYCRINHHEIGADHIIPIVAKSATGS